MILSRKAKEAIKTALALTIAYGIALQMDWDNPLWAGYAVAFVSLSTAGQSFNKAAMRMFGTLIAAVFALVFIALFPQDRWLFMILLSAYVGICTYLMCGPKLQYFWNVCGFVCVIICMSAGPDPVNAFEVVILRTEETGLGILVYSLVAILLWPVSSRKDFFDVARNLTSGQRQLSQASFALFQKDDTGQVAELKGKMLQLQTRFHQLLDAAESDTYEVREMRRQWRLFETHVVKLTETIGQCYQSLSEIQRLEISPLLSNLDGYKAELDRRFHEIEKMIAGERPGHQTRNIDLIMDTARLESVSHFENAVLIVFRSRLEELDQLTRILFETVSNIGGFGKHDVSIKTGPALPTTVFPDLDRLLAAVRVILAMWIAYLAYIYVESIPGSSGLVTMSTVFSMIVASIPHIPIMMLFIPLMVGVAFGCVMYIFILPHLSSFIGLGALLFSVTFALCYLLSSPKQALGKIFGIAMFLGVISISNQQTYSFMVVATNVLMYPLIFLVLAVTAYFPINLRSEKSFLRLLERYFRSCVYLLSSMHSDMKHVEGGLERWRKAFHLQIVSSVPTKLGAWAKFLDQKTLPGTSPQHIGPAMAGLQELTARMMELIEERSTLKNQFLANELRDDASNWRFILKEAFEGLGSASMDVDREAFRNRLDGIMNKLEIRIKDTLDKTSEEQVDRGDSENFYRLLDAYRGVSEALVRYTGSAGDINWARWREERF